MDRKKQLIEKITEEMNKFKNLGHNVTEHEVVIKYLKTGIIPNNLYDYELLDAVVHDFDTVYNDYIN